MTNSIPKIIYFDYWTIGINNFVFFDSLLKAKGVETKLIHLSSWRGIVRDDHQIIHGIDCYDIRYYNTNIIYQVLKEEMPDAVVMLNASFITDRTIILSCKSLGIKSTYLMHGSITREDFIEESAKSINHSMKKNRFNRALKHVRGTVFNYLFAITRFNYKYLFKLHAYKVLFRTFIDPGNYLHFPPPSFDLIPDLTLVYSTLDLEYYQKRLLSSNSVIEVVGNPDMDKYFKEIGIIEENKEQFCRTNNIPTDKPYITYIEEGLVEDKIWDNDYRIKFFNEINEICNEQGFHLVIKIHPRTTNGPYLDSFSLLKGVTVLSHTNFTKLIFFTSKCISHYSTTLIYPMLLGKVILVPRWGQSASLLTIYTDKEVTFVYSLDEFKMRISDSNFQYNRSNYINNFVSFKDGKTSERIANHILHLIK